MSIKDEGLHSSSKAFSGTPHTPKDPELKPQGPSNDTIISTKPTLQTTVQPVHTAQR